jgi:hypothetical protein
MCRMRLTVYTFFNLISLLFKKHRFTTIMKSNFDEVSKQFHQSQYRKSYKHTHLLVISSEQSATLSVRRTRVWIKRGANCLQNIYGRAKDICQLPYRPVLTVCVLLMNKLHGEKSSNYSRNSCSFNGTWNFITVPSVPLDSNIVYRRVQIMKLLTVHFHSPIITLCYVTPSDCLLAVNDIWKWWW